ncbi:transglycosylase family protein [Streptomyces sp. NPDC046197]|uniref:transglycosylase family protein n=1 Tax=Streptomyces sp. NPDC046197 TaxID=3154337 RepID=UPI0033FC21F8
MLSGNGRHRRPRQAPALLVAAGVTGSAIAIPLLGATGASAADGTTWDKVAECESGGSWSADHGNGYYGGLQLTQDDWEKYGGLAYAQSADQASRSQQIAVAEKILADRGPGAWPTCGLLSGLTRNSGSVDVDTGVGNGSSSGSGSSHSSDSSSSSGISGSVDSGLSNSSAGSGGSAGSAGSSGPSNSSDPSNSSNSSDPSGYPTGTPDPSGSSDESGTKHASSPSPSTKGDNTAKPGKSTDPTAEGSSSSGGSATTDPNSGESDNPGQNGGSSALVDTGALGSGRHRGGTAAEDLAGSRTDTSSGRHASRDDARAAMEGSYTVRSGDSLASIADSLGLQGGWRALYAANRDAVGADPNHIVAGQTLAIGAETAQK